jgi:hypothetical protein
MEKETNIIDEFYWKIFNVKVHWSGSGDRKKSQKEAKMAYFFVDNFFVLQHCAMKLRMLFAQNSTNKWKKESKRSPCSIRSYSMRTPFCAKKRSITLLGSLEGHHWGHHEIIRGSSWGHHGIIRWVMKGSSWGHHGVIMGSSRGHRGVIMG